MFLDNYSEPFIMEYTNFMLTLFPKGIKHSANTID